jgi:hypothetical protein
MDHNLVNNNVENIIKRPLSSYFQWLQKEGRALILKDNPELKNNVKLTVNKCAEIWRNKSDEEKEPWRNLYLKESKE